MGAIIYTHWLQGPETFGKSDVQAVECQSFKGIYAVLNQKLKVRNVWVFPLSYKSYKLSANYSLNQMHFKVLIINSN